MPIKDNDLIGRRVRLIHCSDQYTKMPPGTLGVIRSIDHLGTVHVSWDNGSNLGMIQGEDRWELVGD